MQITNSNLTSARYNQRQMDQAENMNQGTFSQLVESARTTGSRLTAAHIMQADGLEELYKLLDQQLSDSEDKDPAQEIKDVLEQVARRSFRANWATV